VGVLKAGHLRQTHLRHGNPAHPPTSSQGQAGPSSQPVARHGGHPLQVNDARYTDNDSYSDTSTHGPFLRFIDKMCFPCGHRLAYIPHKHFSRVFQRHPLSTCPSHLPANLAQPQSTLKGKSRVVNQDEAHGNINVSPFSVFLIPSFTLAPQHDALPVFRHSCPRIHRTRQ